MTEAINAGQSRHLYVISAGDGLVKVGVAISPENRRRALATQTKKSLSLNHTVEVDRRYIHEAERLAHDQLWRHCVGGEWFSCPVETAVSAVEFVRRMSVTTPERMATLYTPSAAQIRCASRVLDMSKAEMAAKVGVAEGSLAGWATSYLVPSPDRASRLRHFLRSSGIEWGVLEDGSEFVRHTKDGIVWGTYGCSPRPKFVWVERHANGCRQVEGTAREEWFVQKDDPPRARPKGDN